MIHVSSAILYLNSGVRGERQGKQFVFQLNSHI